MELMHGPKPQHTTVRLENDTEAKLFTSEGLGLFSIGGIRLARDALLARKNSEWPVQITVDNRRLEHAAIRMNNEATRLSAYQSLNGFSDYPHAVENELVLRNMVADINAHLTPEVFPGG